MTRVQFMGDDGKWHDLTGFLSFEVHHPTGPDFTDEEWRRHDSLDALHYAMSARADAARPRVIDQNGNPVSPRPDRPAWQSTYGPPRRH
ncbi:hypothetical protein [Streptomyces sp. SGAir0957]